MSLFTNVSLDINILFAIISLSEVLKKLDKRKRFKRAYVLIPIFLSALASFLITNPLVLKTFALNAFLYTSISSFLYSTVKKTLLGSNGLSLFKTSASTSVPTTTTKPIGSAVPNNIPSSTKISIPKSN